MSLVAVKDKELLEKIQHRFTRLFKELKAVNICTTSSCLGSMVTWRTSESGRLCWSLQNDTASQLYLPATKFLEFNKDRRTRSYQFKLKKRQSAKDIRLHFFSERVKNRWNSLQSEVVSAKTLKLIQNFKARLQQMRDTQMTVGLLVHEEVDLTQKSIWLRSTSSWTSSRAVVPQVVRSLFFRQGVAAPGELLTTSRNSTQKLTTLDYDMEWTVLSAVRPVGCSLAGLS